MAQSLAIWRDKSNENKKLVIHFKKMDLNKFEHLHQQILHVLADDLLVYNVLNYF